MKNYKRKQEIVRCNHCQKEFKKDSSEVKRNLKLSRKIFCSISCSKKDSSNIEHLNKIRSTDILHLKPDNRKDEFSIFRKHLRKIKTRDIGCTVTLEELLEIWNKQQGKCIYSKVQLQASSNTVSNNQIYTLSIDRIDSSKGYTKDNIQFISIAMNHMKNNMTHTETLKLLNILKLNP